MKRFPSAASIPALFVLLLPVVLAVALDYLADIIGGPIHAFSQPTFASKAAGALRLCAWILPLIGIAFAIFKRRPETKANDVLFVCFVIGCFLSLPARIMYAFFHWDK